MRVLNTRPATSVATLAWLFLAAVASACSSDKAKGNGDTSPCHNELSSNAACGDTCKKDSDCAGGNAFLHCSSSICTSDCTAVGKQCTGTCRSNGTCDGVLASEIPGVKPTDPNEPMVSGGAGGGASGGGVTSACATGNASAELSDVTMYIMFDQSLSMRYNDTNTMNTKWTDSTNALVQFLRDPATDGLNIALRFFPSNLPVEGCVNETAGAKEFCQPRLCEKPLVDAGLLTAAAGDPQETLLINAITSASPGSGVASSYNADGTPAFQSGGGTPISAALGGAISWAAKYQAGKQNQKAVVIFVTDGEPQGCEKSTNAIAAIAADGLRAGIATYAIGLEGSAPPLMQAIAQAGGTRQPYLISSGNNATASLLEALNQIRGKSIACDFEVPKADQGKDVDVGKVNVTLTSGGKDSGLFKVNSEGDCKDEAAWYFDNNASPKRMFLCPKACTEVTGRSDVSLKVIFGCATATSPLN